MNMADIGQAKSALESQRANKASHSEWQGFLKGYMRRNILYTIAGNSVIQYVILGQFCKSSVWLLPGIQIQIHLKCLILGKVS